MLRGIEGSEPTNGTGRLQGGNTSPERLAFLMAELVASAIRPGLPRPRSVQNQEHPTRRYPKLNKEDRRTGSRYQRSVRKFSRLNSLPPGGYSRVYGYSRHDADILPSNPQSGELNTKILFRPGIGGTPTPWQQYKRVYLNFPPFGRTELQSMYHRPHQKWDAWDVISAPGSFCQREPKLSSGAEPTVDATAPNSPGWKS